MAVVPVLTLMIYIILCPAC